MFIDYINNDFPSKRTSYTSLPVSSFPLKLIGPGFKISSVLCIFRFSLLALEANVHFANTVNIIIVIISRSISII